MAITLCTPETIQLITVAGGKQYTGGINSDGVELWEGDYKYTNDTSERRQYICRNCTQIFDGRESFEECRRHFGNAVDKPRAS